MFTKYKADFLSIALKQTKAGPRSSGTPVLVTFNISYDIIVGVTNNCVFGRCKCNTCRLYGRFCLSCMMISCNTMTVSLKTFAYRTTFLN